MADNIKLLLEKKNQIFVKTDIRESVEDVQKRFEACTNAPDKLNIAQRLWSKCVVNNMSKPPLYAALMTGMILHSEKSAARKDPETSDTLLRFIFDQYKYSTGYDNEFIQPYAETAKLLVAPTARAWLEAGRPNDAYKLLEDEGRGHWAMASCPEIFSIGVDIAKAFLKQRNISKAYKALTLQDQIIHWGRQQANVSEASKNVENFRHNLNKQVPDDKSKTFEDILNEMKGNNPGGSRSRVIRKVDQTPVIEG